MTKAKADGLAVSRGGGLAILIVATAVIVAILWEATPLMARLMPFLPPSVVQSPPLVETVFNVIVFGTILAIALVGAAILDRRNAAALGHDAAAWFPFGLGIGVLGVSVSAGYAWLAGVLTTAGPVTHPQATLIMWGTAVVALQVLAEETYFRGWLQPALERRWGTLAALIATALVFAGLHVAGGARSPISLANLLLGGLVFGLFALRGGGIAAAFAGHFGWNAVEQLGYGLDPNPGIGNFGSIHDWTLAGAAMWGGSTEGLNASLGMTFVLAAFVVPLAMIGRPGRKPAPLRGTPRVAPAA